VFNTEESTPFPINPKIDERLGFIEPGIFNFQSSIL
jgi:hypothetical protein